MLTYYLQLKMKIKMECHFLMKKLFLKAKSSIWVYGKLTFGVVYTYFESFLTAKYMLGTACTLACKFFQICSNWTKLHTELLFLKQIFSKNGYSENFINKCFKRFVDNTRNVPKTTLTVEKKPLFLVLLNLRSISLKPGTKLKKFQ